MTYIAIAALAFAGWKGLELFKGVTATQPVGWLEYLTAGGTGIGVAATVAVALRAFF